MHSTVSKKAKNHSKKSFVAKGETPPVISFISTANDLENPLQFI